MVCVDEEQTPPSEDDTALSSSRSDDNTQSQKKACWNGRIKSCSLLQQHKSRRLHCNKHNNIKTKRILPQHVPLYTSFLISIIALTLSIIANKSTSFVTLQEPLSAGPFFKNIYNIGLSSWELCVIKEDALHTILQSETDELDVEGEGSGSEYYDCSNLTNKKDKKKCIKDNGQEQSSTSFIMQDGSGNELEHPGTLLELPLLSTVSTSSTTDTSRNVTSHVITTYHYNTPHSLTQTSSNNWMNEPDHDDLLVTGSYPYNDDDIYDNSLPSSYWECHVLYFTSTNVNNDTLWNVSRMFYMIGTILGLTATLLLGTLIILRMKESRVQNKYKDQVVNQLEQNNKRMLKRRCSDVDTNIGNNNELSQQQQQQQQYQSTISKANYLLSLDTNSSGYRPISILYLLSYLFQSLTLLFLDSNVCRTQACSLSYGARLLLAAAVLWIVSGLSLLYNMKCTMYNERQVRRFKRKVLSRNDDSGIVEDDVKCLLPNSPPSLQASHRKVLDLNSSKEDDEATGYCHTTTLNTTFDTDCSDMSTSTSQEVEDVV